MCIILAYSPLQSVSQAFVEGEKEPLSEAFSRIYDIACAYLSIVIRVDETTRTRRVFVYFHFFLTACHDDYGVQIGCVLINPFSSSFVV